MTRLALVVSLTVAALAAPPATARAAVGPLVRLADGPAIRAGGGDWIAWSSAGGVRARDVRTRAEHDVVRPADCDDTGFLLSGPLLVWDCYGGDLRFFDLDRLAPLASTGAEAFQAAVRPSETGTHFELMAAGRHWIRGLSDACYHCDTPMWWNWRTGDFRGSRPFGRGEVEDLDRPSGAYRGCRRGAPRRQGDAAFYGHHPATLHRRGYVMHVREVRVRTELTVRRCRSGRLALSRRVRHLDDAVLGDGALAYVDGSFLHVIDLETSARRSWRTLKGDGDGRLGTTGRTFYWSPRGHGPRYRVRVR